MSEIDARILEWLQLHGSPGAQALADVTVIRRERDANWFTHYETSLDIVCLDAFGNPFTVEVDAEEAAEFVQFISGWPR